MYRVVVGFSLAVLPSALAAYVGSLSLLTKLGASTSAACNVNFDAACSISTAANLNLAVTVALSSTTVTKDLTAVIDDVSAGRYGSPVYPYSNDDVYYPEIWAFNETCMTTRCSELDSNTIASFKTIAEAGGGVLGCNIGGTAYVSMVQHVTGPDSVQYFVLTKYKHIMTSQLPCDRTHGGACANYNVVALAGHMMSRVMVTDSMSTAFDEITTNSDFKLPGGDKDFYGWVYNTDGEAVAHGNGRVGNRLSDFLRTTRFAACNRGGGYVDYGPSRRADTYGSTHGSYVLPVYDAAGGVVYCVGVSYSTAAAPGLASDCEQSYKNALIVLAVLCGVLSIVVCVVVAIACQNKKKQGYCSLTTQVDGEEMNDSFSESAVARVTQRTDVQVATGVDSEDKSAHNL